MVAIDSRNRAQIRKRGLRPGSDSGCTDHPLPNGRHPDQYSRSGHRQTRRLLRAGPRFYAVGECACVSVHGANRLGTNSLLDLVVFGRAAGKHMVQTAKAQHHKPLPANAAERALARLALLDASTSGEYAQCVADDIRTTMQAHAGVFRTAELLAQGAAKINALAARTRRIHLKDKSKVFNTARIEALELDNLIEVARATMISAAARTESRGAHAHRDYPKRDDQHWLRHTLWYSVNDRLEYKPVQLKPLTVESIPPKARTF